MYGISVPLSVYVCRVCVCAAYMHTCVGVCTLLTGECQVSCSISLFVFPLEKVSLSLNLEPGWRAASPNNPQHWDHTRLFMGVVQVQTGALMFTQLTTHLPYPVFGPSFASSVQLGEAACWDAQDPTHRDFILLSTRQKGAPGNCTAEGETGRHEAPWH